MNSQQRYTMDDLVRLSGFTRRTIRYYVQQGLLNPPSGRGRGGFYYDSHLEKLHVIRSLQEKGLGLTTIAGHLRTPSEAVTPPEPEEEQREAWSRFNIVPGLEINARHDLEQRCHRKIKEIVRLSRLLLKEGKNNE